MLNRIFRYLVAEYRRWLLQPQNISLIILILIIRKVVINPLITASINANSPLQIFEPCIAVGNSGLILLLLPIFFIVIISDYPFLDSNLYFVLTRIGRRCWVIAQILFVYIAAFTYVAFLFLATLIQTCFKSYLINGWSLVVTDRNMQSGINELIPLNLYNQMPPMQAVIVTYLLLFLFISLGASVQLLGSAIGRKKVFSIVWILIIMMGMAAVSLRKNIEWLFPSAHSILWIHYDKYYRAVRFPILGSIAILLCMSVILNILAYTRMKKSDFSRLKEG